MSVPVLKALTKRIRKRIGSTEMAALAAGLSNKGAWSLYESENHPDTTLPLHRFLDCANDAEKQTLIDLIRMTMENGGAPACATTQASETTEAAADLQKVVRQAEADGVVTPLERSQIVGKALEVQSQAADVIKAVGAA
ncbi:hypothetical protein [uncultured Brevundimonas sp.]|mgnify:CR=1 FL=1|uniref:hypothetical protein n=1 Tax=uncultured Brevundimonas sp. TaxID=213418 RepID=UPI002617AF75|nr:hypothetical protein [uncultured Brevundimonas sp.]